MKDIGLLVLVMCSDGKCRPALLNDKQAKRVRGFIAAEQGVGNGVIRVEDEPLIVGRQAPAPEKPEEGKAP